MTPRNTGIMWFIVAALLAVIVVLTYLLVVIPAPASNTQATSTTTTTGSTDTTPTNSDVVVDAPKSGASVPKTFTVTGHAPGTWYFEASFPIEVRDPSGLVVGTGHATALSDWMTTAPVAFKADITVASYTGPATLVLKKDNPSGLPQNDSSVVIPITVR